MIYLCCDPEDSLGMAGKQQYVPWKNVVCVMSIRLPTWSYQCTVHTAAAAPCFCFGSEWFIQNWPWQSDIWKNTLHFFLFYLHHFSPFSSLACYHTGVWHKLSSSPFLNRTNREDQVSLDSELTASSNFNQPFHLLYEAVNLLSSSTWDQLVKDLQAHRSQNCLSLPGAKWVSPGL